MAATDAVSFSQRFLESIWESLNGSEVEQNAYDLRRPLDLMIQRGKGFHKRDMGGSFMEANVAVKTMPITTQIAEGNEYALASIEPLQGAKWNWTTAVSPLVFTLEEISENQGRAKLIDTAEFKISQAMTDHMDSINFQFCRGTGTSPSTESLNTLIGTADNGGLSATTYPKWKGYVDSTSQNLSNTAIDKAFDACQFTGAQGIDFILSGPTLFQRYKALGAAATTIFQPADAKKPNAAFQGIEMVTFRDAQWFWSRSIPDVADPLGLGDTANYLYGVNSGTLRMGTLKGYYQAKLEKKLSPVQLAWHIPVVTRYQFGVIQRRSNFKLSNVGTS